MKNFQKELPKTILLTLIIFVVILLLNWISGHKFHFDKELVVLFGFVALYTFLLTFANSTFFSYLDEVFSKNRFSTKRIVIGFIGSFIISLGVIFLLHVFEEIIYNKKSFDEFITNEKPANYVFAIIITFVVSLAMYAFYFFKAYNENKVKEQKIIAGTANAKFESLKNQIDPHFLFNSLNVLSSLIEENPENAQKFTTSLSKIYRYVLEQKDKELVTVEDELAFAKTYMNLLKMRFENSITYDLPSEFNNPEAKVVPLSLQLLLENTIKHNTVSEKKPLHIKIYIKDNYLVVENNLQKKEVLQDRKGVGLQNIISRYAILSERKVFVEETNDVFAIHLPILTKQISVMQPISISNENTAYYRAKKRVEALRGFYGSLISYCIVIPLLMIINLSVMPEFQWFWFSLTGWGIGLIIHAFTVFGYNSNWEERKIKEIMEKDTINSKNWK